MSFNIEVPIFFPVLGFFVILIFGYFLYKINETLKEIKNSNLSNKNNYKKNILNTVEKKIKDENLIISPMVGVIYLAPDPTKAPFVNEGDHIKQGDTVAVIEAMKTFNNVRAPRSGVIKKILVTSGTPVEYGEKIFIIE